MQRALIALGGNIAAPGQPGLRQSMAAAVACLDSGGMCVSAISRWYLTRPVPDGGQPSFLNAVARVERAGAPLSPHLWLEWLHGIEDRFGRRRRVRNGARTLDLDLLALDRHVLRTGPVRLPHPRLVGRSFVLRPLTDIAPAWRHPIDGRRAAALLAARPPSERARVRPLHGSFSVSDSLKIALHCGK